MTNRERILEKMRSRALLFDGATGTYAKSLAGFDEGPVEMACLNKPEQLAALHRAYLDAGAEMIKTNTFAAHCGLAVGDEQEQRQVIHAAWQIAQSAARPYGALVFADIGPASMHEDAFTAYRRMADCFLDAGAECFLFETLANDEGICETAAHIRKKSPGAFIAVSFAADPDGFTRSGEAVKTLISRMDKCCDIDAVGMNCICGAYHLRRLLTLLDGVSKPLIAMPNAGYPHMADGRMYYDSDPAYFAGQVVSCASLGARIIGGCCGTTPAHIAMTARLNQTLVEKKQIREGSAQSEGSFCRSRILAKLRSGNKPVIVEVDPPQSVRKIEGFISGARMLSVQGADAITIADCPIGRASMDASLLACKLTREYGIETLPHMTCRDRNINATKALLLGLSMEGVYNVLAVTGDPVPTSDRGSVRGVFQFHSRVLAKFITSLSQEAEMGKFFLCAALNVNAENFDAEMKKAQEKEACGVMAFLTQPVLSERAAVNLKKARSVLKGYLFGGIFPVVSKRNAMFMASEVAGIDLDERIMMAYEGLDREQGEAMAIKLCADVVNRIDDDVDGYYIMTPFQRHTLVAELVRQIKQRKHH